MLASWALWATNKKKNGSSGVVDRNGAPKEEKNGVSKNLYSAESHQDVYENGKVREKQNGIMMAPANGDKKQVNHSRYSVNIRKPATLNFCSLEKRNVTPTHKFIADIFRQDDSCAQSIFVLLFMLPPKNIWIKNLKGKIQIQYTN